MQMKITPLQLPDIPAAVRLSTHAGWNQLDADWQRLLELWPDCCLAGRVDGRLVATATLARYGPVAWVGMVLVDESHRGQGHGGAIFDAAVTLAEQSGVQSLGLDASDLGKPVYTRRGFVDEFTIDRRMMIADDRAPTSSPADRIYDADWASLLALDRASCGWDRSALLRQICGEPGARCEVVREGGEVTAFGFRRRGRTAEHIGPVVGRGGAVKRVVESLASPSGDAAVIIDTPRYGVLGAWLSDIGFDVKRELTRMWRGNPTPIKDLVAISGFELG
jgi:GNAT superfamily N-acetyltransferase